MAVLLPEAYDKMQIATIYGVRFYQTSDSIKMKLNMHNLARYAS